MYSTSIESTILYAKRMNQTTDKYENFPNSIQLGTHRLVQFVLYRLQFRLSETVFFYAWLLLALPHLISLSRKRQRLSMSMRNEVKFKIIANLNRDDGHIVGRKVWKATIVKSLPITHCKFTSPCHYCRIPSRISIHFV